MWNVLGVITQAVDKQESENEREIWYAEVCCNEIDKMRKKCERTRLYAHKGTASRQRLIVKRSA